MRFLCQMMVAAAILSVPLPALSVTSNTISAGSTAGDGNCGVSTFPGPAEIQSNGAISFDRRSGSSYTGGFCDVSYGARAGFGSGGVGISQTGQNATGTGDTVRVGARSQFTLLFTTPDDWVPGTLVDLSFDAVLSGQLSISGTSFNGASALEGFVFIQGSAGNQPRSSRKSFDELLTPNDIPDGGTGVARNLARTLTTDIISVDPSRDVTVIFSLTGTTRGVGTYETAVGALDTFGFAPGQQIFDDLPTGVALMDAPELGIVNGVFVGAVPLPSAVWALISGLAALWWLGGRGGTGLGAAGAHRPRLLTA